MFLVENAFLVSVWSSVETVLRSVCVCFLGANGHGKYKMGITENASGSLVVVVLLVYNYMQLKNIYAS